MDFYTIVIISAIVLLILLLTIIGLVVSNANSSATFPASYSSCPDYWIYDETTKQCTANKVNIGTLDDPSTKYTPSSNICENLKWSNDNRISWDGVSNTNVCKNK
jgi:hypothetical protein